MLETPFATMVLPSADPVDDDAMRDAHTAVCALYPHGAIATRIANALPLLAERHTWTVTNTAVQIGDDGVQLSKDGQEQICTCPDWRWKRTEHTGLCTHVCACEYLRLAWAQHTHDAALSAVAIDVPRALLWYTLQACLATEDATVRLCFDEAQQHLTIQTDSVVYTIVTTGFGALDQSVDRQRISALCADLPTIPANEHDLVIHRHAGGTLVVLDENAERPL